MNKPIGKDIPPESLTELGRWMRANTALNAARVEEAELRAVIAVHFPSSTTEGTLTCNLPDGWKLKVKAGLTGDIQIELDPEKYRAMNADAKALIASALVITPKTVRLEVVAPERQSAP